MVLALQVEDFSHRFKTHTAVSGLNFSIEAGEIYGLIGPDGAGKTTTLRVCAGVSIPTMGSIRVYGKDPLDIAGGVRSILGYMPQRHSLYGDLTVAENIRFFGDLFDLSAQEFTTRAERLLSITNLTAFRERRADALSGGMYKKLALACALLHKPRLLVLDEPTNGVDPISRIELFSVLAEFAKEGMSALVSTTYMDEASRCQRVGLMHEGSLIATGTLKNLLAQFREAVIHLDRKASLLDDVLAVHKSDLLSLSPMGRGARVVLKRSGLTNFLQDLKSRNISAEEVAPSLEDLFFTLVHRETHHA